MSISRRSFIRTSLFATSVTPIWYATRCTPERKLGVAILGLGNYATNQVAPALMHTQNCQLKGIVTGSPDKVETWKSKYNIPAGNIYNYENFDRIKANSDIDIVYVVTPNALHRDFTIRAAQAGKHVICEKPMEISSARCKEMIMACEKAGVQLQIGYRCQYDPYHRELIRFVQENEYGKAKVIETGFSFYGVNSSNWRFTDASLSGGGPLMDIGVYCIQACRYTLGLDPISVTAQKYKTIMDKLPGMEETITWQFEFDSGVIANCTSSYVARHNRFHISTEKGWADLSPAFSYSLEPGWINGTQMTKVDHNQQAAQMDAFAQNIMDSTPVLASGDEGWRDMVIIEAIYRAAETGEKVVIKY